MEKNQLQRHELEHLIQSYRITLEENNNPLSFPSTKLLDDKFVSELIINLQSIYNVSESFVIASQFMKRYAYMVTVPYFYSLSKWNKQLQFSPENVSFQSMTVEGVWLPRLKLNTLEVTLPNQGDRDEWRRNAIEHLFKNHINRVIKVLAPAGKISRQVLWENTAIYIFWIYEEMLKDNRSELIKGDFEFVLEADGSLFGEYTYNPISKFYREKQSADEVRIRKTCCFYNRLPGIVDQCSTCPVTCRLPEEGDGICG